MQEYPYLILNLAVQAATAGAIERAREPRLGARITPDATGTDGYLLEVAKLAPAEAASLRQSPERVVAPILPTKLIHPMGSVSATAPSAPGATWGVEAVGAAACPLAGAGVTVAVLDTGIDDGHEAFAGLAVQCEGFLGGGACADDVGHGTHCAGTIAGQEVNGHRFGVAPGIDRLLCGTVVGPGGGTTDALAKGIMWAREEGADIISMSLGFDFPKHVENLIASGIPRPAATSQALVGYGEHLALFHALTSLVASPLLSGAQSLLVAAAGNESARTGSPPYTIESSPPAAAEGVVAVGALQRESDGSLTTAGFSNTGVAVAAPGVNIFSAAPGGQYATLSGTSMATPHVAGVAALWAQALTDSGGSSSPDLLQARLVGSARSLPGSVSADVGAGLVQAPGQSGVAR